MALIRKRQHTVRIDLQLLLVSVYSEVQILVRTAVSLLCFYSALALSSLLTSFSNSSGRLRKKTLFP